MKANNTVQSFYSFDKAMSYNAAYNFIVGARGLGKTYGAKRMVINRAIRYDEMFIYLRRYKEDLKGRFTFFADVMHEFPEWDFRVNGMNAEMAPSDTREDKKRPWKLIGYFIALSQSASYKSVAYPKVTKIIFDEFIIEKGVIKYLTNEAKVFNDFYSTVDRYKDKTTVLFLANAISITNPYFLEFDIKPSDSTEYKVLYDGFILTHFPDAAQFQNEVYATRFGRFIKDTDYAEYSVGSIFSDDSEQMLALKDASAKYRFSLETSMGTFSVWWDVNTNYFYIQSTLPKQQLLYTLLPENISADKLLLMRNDKVLQYLRTAFTMGRMWFDTSKSRNAFVEIFRK